MMLHMLPAPSVAGGSYSITYGFCSSPSECDVTTTADSQICTELCTLFKKHESLPGINHLWPQIGTLCAQFKIHKTFIHQITILWAQISIVWTQMTILWGTF